MSTFRYQLNQQSWALPQKKWCRWQRMTRIAPMGDCAGTLREFFL